MTLYRETSPALFVPWSGDPIQGVRYPLSIEQQWSAPELAAIDLYVPAPADPVPEGKIVVATDVQRNDGVVKFVHTLEDAPGPSTDPADYPLLPWQFKALVIYLDVDTDIRAAIMQIPDAMQRAATMSRYENSTEYRYDDPLVEPLREAVGMPEQDLIDAWMIAKDLRSSA